MNTLRNFLYAIVALLTFTLGALSAETNWSWTTTNAVKLTAPPTNPGRLYLDAGLSLRTTDLKEGDYGSLVGVGYQVSPHWAIEGRLARHGLDASGSAVQDIGGRLVARMPFGFLSPYTFLGTSFDLERDRWSLQPGAGIEFGVNKRLKGLSVFTEAGLDTRLEGGALRDPGWVLTGGVRWRF